MRDANGKQWTHWHYDHVLGFIFTYVQYHFISELVFSPCPMPTQFGIRISFCFVSTFPFKVSCTQKLWPILFMYVHIIAQLCIPKLVRKWFFDVCTIR